MSFPVYPAYKKTDVEWLGEVPEHWILTPLKHLALLNPRKSGYDGDTEQLCSFVPMEKLKTGVVQLDEERPVGEVIGGYTYFEDGDVLQAKVTPCFENKNIAIAKGLTNGIGFGSSEINVLRPYQGVNAEYLYYRVQEDSYMDFCTSSMIGAGGLKRVPTDVINNFKVATPEVFEQTQIARFLDHETARIDALIEEQQRLIELLKEKRQAVISHAVTKGLDPTVPMKDSGVEWLGEVPAHWDVVAIKWLSPVLRGASPRPIDDPKYFDDSGEYAWVRIADVSASDGTLRETTQTLSALGASLSVKMEPGEMFLSIAGTVGKPCITQIKACIHDGFVYFPSLSIDNKFLYRIFEVGTCYGGLGKMGTQLNLNTETVGGIQIGVPPNSEIAQILEFIDRQSSAFDSLIGEAARGVELLQERRSALISAAVTGKIDVRGWQPPASASSPELVQEAV